MTDHPNERPGSDRSPTVDQPGTDRSEVTVAEAAVLLGLSTDAVRSRLNRGTLDGRKDAGGWVVLLPRPSATVDQPSATGHRPSADRDATVAYERLVEGQAREIAFLRAHLEETQAAREAAEHRHAAELERRDVLLREALGRIPALTAGDVVAQDAAPTRSEATGATEGREVGQVPVPWWRFWERRR
jgi:hypothetical protein